MVDKTLYPQIPARVWWGLRGVLRKKTGIRFDDSALAAELGVQVAASRQYLTEFKRVGLLTDEGGTTQLANKWRMDETYREAADEILASLYPETLIHIAPSGEAERGKVEKWFMSQGMGEGTARNKAATYVMIANESLPENADTKASPRGNKPRKQKRKHVENAGPTTDKRAQSLLRSGAPIPLNVNVQIHISAEATSEQIQNIFISMRKYLYEGADD